MADEEELDFSTYLVDIDDDEDAGNNSGTSNSVGISDLPSSYVPPSLLSLSATSSGSPAAAGLIFQPVQTHSAKNWSGQLSQQRGFISTSPSPTESASDSSYKASTTSTAGTAPSSIASTSYPDSGSSWGTQKTLGSKKPNSTRPSALSASRKSPSTSTDNTPPASASQQHPLLSASIATSHNPQNAFNLAFNYDFAHNPVISTGFNAPAASTSTAQLFKDATFDPQQYSASLPAASSSGFGSRSARASVDKSVPAGNSKECSLLGKPISPSSGPQHVGKGHRSRQSSTSNAFSSSLGSSGPSPHWLSMTPSIPSVTIPQFADTPYSRPVVLTNDTTSALGNSLMNASTGHPGGLTKRPSKRKNISNASTASLHQLQTNSNFQQPSHEQPSSAAPVVPSPYTNASAGMQQFGFPIPAPAYREPISSLASPISPSLESFSSIANFMPASASISAVTSPSMTQPNLTSAPTSKPTSNASTPNDAILSAVTAPSPFDPRNFGSLEFDPLAGDDFSAQLASYGANATAEEMAASLAAFEINKAAALAGIGGKWINWTNNQDESRQTDAALISDVLSRAPEISTAPTPAASSQGGSSGSAKNTTTSPQTFDTFPVREGSVTSNAFGDLGGETPEEMAAKDPLATHLWRLYAKAKPGLPNGARMENITWRMMSLKLNKQKADAAAGLIPSTHGSRTQTAPAAEGPAVTQAEKQDQPSEENERGRRGRSTQPNSASPADSGDIGDMDWRNQSRSRSRVPQAITGGMDWRNASRSRSRAPNMRFSLPSGPAGVHLPTYADIVETMASVGRADVSTAAAPAAQVPLQTPQGGKQQVNNQTSEAELQSFEQTLKQLIAEGEAAAGNTQAHDNPDKSQTAGKRASRNLESTVLPYSYIPPAPLPISPSNWMNSPPATQELSGIPQASSVPKHAQPQPQQAAEQLSYAVANFAGQAQQYAASPIAAVENGLLQSQNSITASVEAYLSSLGHATSVIDLPPHRHIGSVPGLFNEQDLKANQHADYGFLPKLVRKTSFDASYPAQLAHEQQKQAQKKQRTPQQFAQPLPQMTDHQAQSQSHEAMNQTWLDPNNLFMMDNINSYLRGPAQSVPSTPSIATANLAYNYFANAQLGAFGAHTPYAASSPDAQAQAQAQAQVQAQAQAQSAAVEAFRRLQTAQALQAANAAAQQQARQGYSSYLDASFVGSPGSIPPELLAAMSPGQFGNGGMHINPSQMSNSQYPPNAYAAYSDIAHTQWQGSPQSNHTSPNNHIPSPEDYAHAAEEEHVRSAAASRSSSLTNIPSLLSQSYKPDDSQEASGNDTAVTKKSHSRQQSSITLPVHTITAITDNSGPPTVCVNCKTTNTPLWRRDELGQPLCNACQLFRKLHGSDRPVSLHNSVVKKRNRTRNNKDAPKKTTARSQRNSMGAPKSPEDTPPENETP